MLHQQIKESIKTAMRDKDALRLSVLRALLAAFTNELVATKRKPDEELSDEEALTVIKRQAKQRKDSIAQFSAGGRNELAETERRELTVLEAFLPDMMSVDEIKKIAQAKKQELGVSDAAEKGKLMGALMQELRGKAEGEDVKRVVDELLA